MIHNPVNYLPIYTPSEERIAEISKEYADTNPLNVYYDASKEVRAKGAGFYQFSADEETRKKQMEELKNVREETEKTRKDLGAVDILPGELEGMREGPTKSRAMEKRKREIEERRRLLEEKKKRKISPSAESGNIARVQAETRTTSLPEADPFAVLESIAPPKPAPFAKKSQATSDAAGVFLAQLQQEFLSAKKR